MNKTSLADFDGRRRKRRRKPHYVKKGKNCFVRLKGGKLKRTKKKNCKGK